MDHAIYPDLIWGPITLGTYCMVVESFAKFIQTMTYSGDENGMQYKDLNRILHIEKP